uniref:Ankyrin repeat and sterile alpha motif domain containing 1B n=1 Tax=Coturnix japonica TaxID=93934 RepID=A0A8C2Y8F8_COTJA
MGKDQELLEAARTGNVALVEKLLSGRKGGILGSGSGAIPLSSLLSIWRGPNINCTDSSGYTALHHAALNGHKDIVLKLLQYEASTNVADNKGYFPIHLAAWRGDVDIVKILIHHGPSHSRVNEQNNENETALHCAAQYGHSEVVAVLLEELTDPTIRNNKLETPLDLAALYGRLRVVKMIIKAYPNLMNCNTRKHTPLHLAARNGHKAVVQVLLEAGMDVSCQTEKGSALHEAALFGKVEVARILLETGVDTNIKDSLGRTVLDILKEHPSQQSLQIVALLQGKSYSVTSPCPTLNTSKDGASTTSLGSLFQDLTTLLVKNFPLTSNLNLPSFNLKPFPRVLLLSALSKSLLPSWEFFKGIFSLLVVFYHPPLPPSLPPPFPFFFSYKIFSFISECLCQGEKSTESELPEGHSTEQFAGLLHGSSPACDPPDNPLQLYSKRNPCTGPLDKSILSKSTIQQMQLRKESNTDPPVKKKKPPVVNRTIFHSKTKPLENHTLVGTSTRISEQWVITTGGFVERACTLGRIRSLPKTLLEMHLCKNVSKSDSNLITHPPSGKKARSNWSEPTPSQQCSKGNSERTPSFTSEWEEVSSVHFYKQIFRPRCPVQTVGQWLENIGLPQYENHLLANGFDNVQFMGSNVMEDQDLLEIGILNSGHRQRILQAIQLLPKMKQIGHDGYNPASVAEWLDSIELGDYTKSFLINGYTSMDLVKKIWEIELINVLKISLIGHRKRVLASLGDRLHEDPPQKPPRSITLRLSPSLSQSTFTTGGSLDVPHIIMQGDARRRRNENYFDDIPRSKLERQMAQTGDWGEPSITLRPPNEATASTPVQYWQHHPEKLIFQSCDYKAFYLGSMLVKELRGTESTQDACAKMRKSTEQMKKVPTIVLSVSYKGVKFIDATNKNIIAEHEIRNISCAAQDPEDLSTFAYITKDLKTNHHYCHVFTAFDVNLAYEIILTLGQAFEVAYQLALQARKGGHSSTLPESFENKPSKPIPKPRVSIRKSVVSRMEWCVNKNQHSAIQ